MTMKQRQIIRTVVQILQKNYRDDTSGHDWWHLERVWKMARRLANGERVNHFVLEMAALLHDVDDYKVKQPGARRSLNGRRKSSVRISLTMK